MRAVCVFCGSNPGRRPEYLAGAAGLARLLAGRGIGIVYGGAHVGTMGALADAALAAGGEVTGVIPRHLVEAEVAHEGLSKLHVVSSMHDRKALMAQLSDAFIALPGGLGTLEEFAEVTTWSQLGLHAKPTGLLNLLGYFDDLLRFLDHGVAERFIRPTHRDLVICQPEPAALLAALEEWQAPAGHKWMDADGSDLAVRRRS
ncbi:MAG TPA: TIGR00730 family Rossman fold protein [Actinobacteria bacterium]|nr:TIGR00730 family Rossman fold protein [Actinomycetota bacterium]